VSWIADNGVVKISDLNLYISVGIGYRTEISRVTITANPDRGAFG
jgi:hypothetical protein